LGGELLAVIGQRAGMDEICGCHGGQGPEARLLDHAEDVDEEGRLGDFVAFDAVELRVADHHGFAVGLDG